jgi:glycerol kinase
MPLLLAIDQSTSATKALLYDARGGLLDKESCDHRQIYPQPGWVEHDAGEIWRNTLEAARKLLSRHTQNISQLASLSITNQRETIVVFERGSGKPLRNAIVWQCRRGDAICRDLAAASHGERVTRLTGLRLDTYFSASKIKWLLNDRPDLAHRIAKGEALIGTIDAYLIYRLTRGEVFATDHTNASRTLLYDIAALRWDPWLCEIFEVPAAALPEVRESTAAFGETTFEGLLAAPVPIRGVMGDSQASLFAQRCFEPGMTKVTFGSGSSVLMNIGGELRYSKSGAVSTIAWVHNGKPVYAFEGLINYSAATIAWLKDQLGLIQSAKECSALAQSVPDNGGVYLVPAFSGLSAPYWSPRARAAITGLTAHSNRSHVVRAAEESIAYQLRDIMEMMKDETGISLRRIHADGGPTRDVFLMAFTADMLGLEVHASDVPDCSALGAVFAGMLGLGLLAGFDALNKLPRETKIFRPAMNAEVADRNYAGWKQAVHRVL